jgi:hypothetical protein
LDRHCLTNGDHARALTTLTVHRDKAIMADTHSTECRPIMTVSSLAEYRFTTRSQGRSDAITRRGRDVLAIKGKDDFPHSGVSVGKQANAGKCLGDISHFTVWQGQTRRTRGTHRLID